MTDPLAPLSDEDLSALLDGPADPSVLDRLARDPAARARRDALAAAATAVSAEPIAPLTSPQVDDLIAQALAVGLASEAPSTGAPGAPVAPVTPLAPPAGRRLPPTWLVAAVVVAFVAIGLGLVWSGRSTSDDRQDTASDQLTLEEEAGSPSRSADADDAPLAGSSSESESESAGPTTNGAVPNETTMEPAPEIPSIEERLGPPRYLGSFATAEDLRAAVAQALPGTDAPLGDLELPTDAAFQRCAEQMRVQFSIDDPATAYRLALVGDVVSMVYEFDAATFDDGEPAQLVIAVRADTCDPYFTIQR